jgi:hypothetical protein
LVQMTWPAFLRVKPPHLPLCWSRARRTWVRGIMELVALGGWLDLLMAWASVGSYTCRGWGSSWAALLCILSTC